MTAENTLWQQIQTMFRKSGNHCQIYTGEEESGRADVRSLGIAEDSPLGAILVHTSGVVVDHWVRILGQSAEERPGVLDYGKREDAIFQGLAVVAEDVVGGIFAINAGRFESGKGKIWYFGPDTLQWNCLNLKYAELLAWLAQGDLNSFYAKMRWENWQKDAAETEFHQGILLYPFLWAKECDVNTADKKRVSFEEMIRMNAEYAQKFGTN